MTISCCLIILAPCCFHSLGEPVAMSTVEPVFQKGILKDRSLWIQEEFRGQFSSELYPRDLYLSWCYWETDSRKSNQPEALRTQSCNGMLTLLLPGNGILNQSPDFLQKQKRVKSECCVDRICIPLLNNPLYLLGQIAESRSLNFLIYILAIKESLSQCW